MLTGSTLAEALTHFIAETRGWGLGRIELTYQSLTLSALLDQVDQSPFQGPTSIDRSARNKKVISPPPTDPTRNRHGAASSRNQTHPYFRQSKHSAWVSLDGPCKRRDFNPRTDATSVDMDFDSSGESRHQFHARVMQAVQALLAQSARQGWSSAVVVSHELCRLPA